MEKMLFGKEIDDAFVRASIITAFSFSYNHPKQKQFQSYIIAQKKVLKNISEKLQKKIAKFFCSKDFATAM